MDPQIFIRLSIDSLGLRIPGTTATTKSGIRIISSPCSCEIRLRGFPVQTKSVPFVSVSEAIHPTNAASSSFYLEESDLKALRTPNCFYAPQGGFLEIIVFAGRKGSHCGVGIKRQQIGTFRLEIGQEWCLGKAMVLCNGWVGIGKNNGKPDAELHLRVRLDPDPRFVFQFEDEIKLSPQVVQLRGSIKQPLFSCKFSRDRVSSIDGSEQDTGKRERKGWKVKIHDLSGSVVAATFITTPFVPSSGCDWVARSNPGAWLIARPDACRPESWHPWGKLEAWRDRSGTRDAVCCRFRLLSENLPEDGKDALVSEVLISTEKGGEFFIDTDRHLRAGPTPDISGGGFVMSCRVQGEGKSSKPMVQLAMKHITCVEDAAIFMALAAAVDLSIEACRPFRKKLRIRRGYTNSW
ncbi:uncharacterized protein LOC124941913 [Impatiens glandulifera]|uniref:uncharacterized protein LOC124941913 n=1 Tax=Impatiens glandulifera TaxID=253017 RepID=UPI001FB11EF5|nr:uncharacterized protein LOC124941913 [Impatiens glandulifera]XP_047338250.1 uncharacterized protein LOC124941913 [Impatiens glandulifera]